MKDKPNKATVNDGWKLIGHSHQIADTGDYDGHYEITNGKISLLTQDDDDESLQPIVGALNDSGCKFYQDDCFEFENKMLKDENAELRERVKELEGTVSELRTAFANYWVSEGCSCCRDSDNHRDAEHAIGELLGVAKHDDESGYDFNQYQTIYK